jgi:hypothetical protein
MTVVLLYKIVCWKFVFRATTKQAVQDLCCVADVRWSSQTTEDVRQSPSDYWRCTPKFFRPLKMSAKVLRPLKMYAEVLKMYAEVLQTTEDVRRSSSDHWRCPPKFFRLLKMSAKVLRPLKMYAEVLKMYAEVLQTTEDVRRSSSGYCNTRVEKASDW